MESYIISLHSLNFAHSSSVILSVAYGTPTLWAQNRSIVSCHCCMGVSATVLAIRKLIISDCGVCNDVHMGSVHDNDTAQILQDDNDDACDDTRDNDNADGDDRV